VLESLRQNWHNAVNLGCGELKFEGSINCDICGDVDMMLDAQMLPFKSDSLGMIEAHHLLEHFGHGETRKILREWRRCICDKGLLVISVPDCEAMFSLMTSERTRAIPEKVKWNALNMYIYGNQEHEGQYHKSGFSSQYLGQILMDEGFKIVDIWRGFPNRPTPSFCIIAKKEGGEEQ